MLARMLRAFAFVLLAGCVLRDAGDEPTGAESASGSNTGTSASGTSASGTTGNSDMTLTGDVDPGSASTSTDSDSSEGSITSAETTDAGSSTGTEHVCEFDEHFSCDEVPWDCRASEDHHGFNCGGPLSWFDEHGCLRNACDEEGLCADGFSCINPSQACGVCSGPQPNCEIVESSQGLACGCSQDGACGGSICVPAELLVGDPCSS